MSSPIANPGDSLAGYELRDQIGEGGTSVVFRGEHEEHGVDPDFVEAMLFAWLARERINARSPRALGAVTGSKEAAVLGGVWLPPRG